MSISGKVAATNPQAGRQRLPYGEGIFRRRYRLALEPGRVLADLEDDFHRFRVELVHDGERVTAVHGVALRFPWTACGGAVAPLRALEGMPLSPRFSAAAGHANPRVNCTHLFDLASLAVAHAGQARASDAGRARECTRIDIAVPDCDAKARTRPTLHRDGELVLAWEVEGARIAAPDPFSGQPLRGGGLLAWAEANLDLELAEATLLLRRGLFIAMGRARDLDEAPSAMAYMPLTKGTCHSFTPGIAETAARVRGTSLEFTHAPDALLADLA